MGRPQKMGLHKTTFVGWLQGTMVYSPVECSKSYHQKVESIFVEQVNEYLSFVVTIEVGGRTLGKSWQSKSGSGP